MTVTNLDPPQSRLRLVSSEGPAPRRDRRYRSGAQLGREARLLHSEVLRAMLELGTPVDADALRVVLAAKQANHPGPIRRFTGTSIWQLMFVDVIVWCHGRQLDVPPGATDALRALIDYLAVTDSFAPGSDRLSSLYLAIDECTGDWADPDDTPVAPRRRRSVRSARGPKRS